VAVKGVQIGVKSSVSKVKLHRGRGYDLTEKGECQLVKGGRVVVVYSERKLPDRREEGITRCELGQISRAANGQHNSGGKKKGVKHGRSYHGQHLFGGGDGGRVSGSEGVGLRKKKGHNRNWVYGMGHKVLKGT